MDNDKIKKQEKEISNIIFKLQIAIKYSKKLDEKNKKTIYKYLDLFVKYDSLDKKLKIIEKLETFFDKNVIKYLNIGVIPAKEFLFKDEIHSYEITDYNLTNNFIKGLRKIIQIYYSIEKEQTRNSIDSKKNDYSKYTDDVNNKKTQQIDQSSQIGSQRKENLVVDREKEYVTKQEKEYIHNLIYSKEPFYGLTEQEKQMIKRIYDRNSSISNDYYTLENMRIYIKCFNNLNSGKKHSFLEMYRMMQNVSDLLYDYLMVFCTPKLHIAFSDFNAVTLLKKYVEQYDKFIKYFDKLNTEEKERQINECKNHYNLSNCSIDTISPNNLIKSVNRKISNDIVSSPYEYMKSDINYHAFSGLSRACQFMNFEEIKTVYRRINKEHRTEQALCTLQSNFCNCIKNNLIENGILQTPKTKEEENNIKYSICIDILEEEPLIDYKKTSKIDLKSLTQTRNSSLDDLLIKKTFLQNLKNKILLFGKKENEKSSIKK